MCIFKFTIAVDAKVFPSVLYELPFFHILANTCFIFPFLRILTCVGWYLTVILICISLIISYEHFFMNLLAICVSLRKKHLFSSSVQFLTRLSGVLKFLSCMRSSYIFDINPIFDISLANTFSHSVGYFFILSMVSFAVHRFFSFDAISLVKFCVCFIIYPIVVQFPYLWLFQFSCSWFPVSFHCNQRGCIWFQSS